MRTRLSLVIIFTTACLVGVSAAPMFHCELIRSLPSAGVTLKTPPARLQLWFSQVPAQDVSTISLKAGAKAVAVGKTVIVPAEKSMYVEPASPLAAGSYTLHWRGAGDDGHVQQGDIAFTIGTKQP